MSKKKPWQIEPPAPSTLQSAADVARRCIVLLAVVASADGRHRAELLPWLEREGLLPHVSPRELILLQASSLTEAQEISGSWRIEAILPLLWALHRLPELPPHLDDNIRIGELMPLPLQPTAQFIAEAELRDEAVLQEEQDAVYNEHWAVRDARLHDRPPPPGLDPDVIMERHHALNWLINTSNEPWDEVSMDT
jgi:hypothetical protein